MDALVQARERDATYSRLPTRMDARPAEGTGRGTDAPAVRPPTAPLAPSSQPETPGQLPDSLVAFPENKGYLLHSLTLAFPVLPRLVLRRDCSRCRDFLHHIVGQLLLLLGLHLAGEPPPETFLEICFAGKIRLTESLIRIHICPAFLIL